MNFDDNGLIPAIVQHARSGEVLMLGYMNEESLRLTRESGMVTFYSRSRHQLWRKGFLDWFAWVGPMGAYVFFFIRH